MSEAHVEERRPVTILFCDLSDSTGLTSSLEPEQFAEILEQIRAVADRAILTHGGEVIRMDGDGMLCIFGYPGIYEDAGRRATEAALDIHIGLAALAPTLRSTRPLNLHSGIHAGMVLLRSGDIVRGKYEILGDATNTAARLCDAAGPGEILVSAETLGAEHHFFETSGCLDRLLRGKSKPLRAWSVTGRAGVGTRYEARALDGLTPFRARTDESARFRTWLAGATPLLQIHGPAGIGKSRFLREETSQAVSRGWRVASGWCESYLSAQPLQPFRQIASVLGVGGEPTDTTAGIDPTALRDAIAAERKLLLVIDDWQWADDASVDLLTALLRDEYLADRLKVVTASRKEADGTQSVPRADRLPLLPFERGDAIATIRGLLQPPDPFVAERIEQAAGGSPLLIEELCHGFRAGTFSMTQDLRSAWFDQSVQARFSHLEQAERDLLKLFAVIGHVAPAWLIDALLGAPLTEPLRDRLREADFLFAGETDETYRFKHGLTRDAIYAAISPADRRALHARILSTLENHLAHVPREQLRDAMAHHAVASGSEAGLPLAVEAGDAALAAGALDRAQAHYSAGLGLIGALATGAAKRDWAWTYLNKFGLACVVDPAPDQLEVLAGAQAILEAHGSPRDRMRGIYWNGAIAYGLGRGKQAVRHFEAARAIALDHGSAGDIRTIQAKLAHSLFTCARIAESVDAFEALFPELARASLPHDRGLSAYSHACFGFLHSERGDFARADALFDQADAILANPDDAINASILLYRAAAKVSQGEWEGAIRVTDAILSVSQRSRTRMQNRTCRAQAAYSRWRLTQDPRAADDLVNAARVFVDPGNSQQYCSMVFGWVVDVAADRGDADLAREFMGAVLQRARRAGDRLGEAMGWRAMARLAQAGGDPTRADRRLAHARRSATVRLSRREAAQNIVCEAELLRARGQTAQASVLLRAAAREFADMQMPGHVARIAALTSR